MNTHISIKANPHQDYIPIGKEADSKLKELVVLNSEIIKVEDTPIEYPCDRINPADYSFKKSELEKKENDPRIPSHNEKLLKIYTLFPPIIVNLRKDAKPESKDTREVLTPLELEYFKHKGSAIVFIHGFNVEYGEYANQIVGLKEETASHFSSQSTLDNSLIYSESVSTLLKNQVLVEQHFNKTKPLPFRLNDEDLNGIGAHNWFVHMENNINLASGLFSYNDYSRYRRLIHIAWSGDVLPSNYLDAEEIADESGKALVNLIKQLSDHEIKIYIIAHSLGSRVLLNSMQFLSENGLNQPIKQVFLWQAAVSDCALSNDPKRDHSVKNNAHFTKAHLAAEKITVLYSKNDWVLRYYYFLINRIGLSPKQFFNPSEAFSLFYRFMDENPLEILATAKLIEGDVKQLTHLARNDKNLDLFIRMLKECYRLTKTALAMGYHGVDLKDPFMHDLINKGKLILVNQINLTGHSAMKIPDEITLNIIYKRWIVNARHGIVI